MSHNLLQAQGSAVFYETYSKKIEKHYGEEKLFLKYFGFELNTILRRQTARNINVKNKKSLLIAKK